MGDTKKEPFKKRLHLKPLGSKSLVAPHPPKKTEHNQTKPLIFLKKGQRFSLKEKNEFLVVTRAC